MNIKLKRDKTPLKRFITLEKYKNNKILNADKNVKKTKPNFLQDNKFSIETLTYSSSSFNQKSNIFQESDLLVSQKSIKQNNIKKVIFIQPFLYIGDSSSFSVKFFIRYLISINY